MYSVNMYYIIHVILKSVQRELAREEGRDTIIIQFKHKLKLKCSYIIL